MPRELSRSRHPQEHWNPGNVQPCTASSLHGGCRANSAALRLPKAGRRGAVPEAWAAPCRAKGMGMGLSRGPTATAGRAGAARGCEQPFPSSHSHCSLSRHEHKPFLARMGCSASLVREGMDNSFSAFYLHLPEVSIDYGGHQGLE